MPLRQGHRIKTEHDQVHAIVSFARLFGVHRLFRSGANATCAERRTCCPPAAGNGAAGYPRTGTGCAAAFPARVPRDRQAAAATPRVLASRARPGRAIARLFLLPLRGRPHTGDAASGAAPSVLARGHFSLACRTPICRGGSPARVARAHPNAETQGILHGGATRRAGAGGRHRG